jgi:Flp pilus assembly protein TadD
LAQGRGLILKLLTDAAAAWNSLGIALAMQGQTKEAAQAFLKAISRDPQKKEYRLNLEKINPGDR